MDSEAFIRWALDDARDVEERYTVELLVETGVSWWHSRHQTGQFERMEVKMERNRQRKLNPAYDPRYSEEDLVRACEMFPEIKTWDHQAYSERPIRDLKALAFFTDVETLNLRCTAVDLTPLTEMTHLRNLGFTGTACEDFRPLARCHELRSLSLHFAVPWPEVAGLETLQDLETLSLSGNLLTLSPETVWPRVRTGTLACSPLPARWMAGLPWFPACEFLTLSGVDRLDGIGRFPRLRNLTLTGPVRDFTPLAELQELTWLRYAGERPRDVSPLARLPRLQCLYFDAQPGFIDPEKPRDYSPLAEAPALRELHVLGCPPVEMEVAAINAALPPCDDLWLTETPRPLPPLRMIVAPHNKHPRRTEPHRAPGEPDLLDTGIRQREGWWVNRFVTRMISERLGHSDWGDVSGYGEYRNFHVTISSFDVVEKLPEILDAMRCALARLRHDYVASFIIALVSPRPKATPAQVELERQFREEQDRAYFEQHQKDRDEYLERLHLHELKRQEGEAVDPGEFVAPEPQPPPPAPWEKAIEDQDEDDDEDDEEGGGAWVAEKKLPDPPPSWFDDEHPLADNYRMLGALTLDEVWFLPHHRDVAVYLMGREPDLEMPKEPEQ